MTLTIIGTNDIPVAVADSGAVAANAVSRVDAASGLLGNDRDPDTGDTPARIVAVNGAAAGVGQEVTLASGALLTVRADGSYIYDPAGAYVSLAAGATATDSFTYTVSDRSGGTATAPVTITITGVNSAPVASADGAMTGEAQRLGVPARGVLANDPGSQHRRPAGSCRRG